MSLGKNTLINLAGAIVPIFVTLVTVPPFLDLIGLERYGILTIIWVLLGYFGFLDFGFGRAIAQRMAKLKNATEQERSTLLWTALSATFLFGILAGLTLWLSADYLLLHFIDISIENRIEVSQSIIWLIVALPILLPSSVLQGALQGRELFLSLNVIQVIGSTLSQVIPLIVAWNGYLTLDFLIPAVLVARLVTTGLSLVICKKDRSLLGFPGIDMNHLRPLMNYGGWISIISLLAPLLVTIDKLVIAAMSGAKSVTLYTIPYSLVSKVLIIPSSLSSAVFPRFAYVDKNEENTLAVNATKILVTVMTPIVMIGILFVNPFLGVWIDESFAIESQGVGELLLLGVWFNSIAFVYHAKILATRSPKIIAFIYLLEIPVYFLLLWTGLTWFGIVGAAGAWALRSLMDTMIILYLSDVIVKTLNYILVPLGFLIVTIMINVFFGSDFFLRFSLGFILIATFIIYDRKQIGDIINKFRPYRKEHNAGE